jgi:sedoheptulose-bisphosphatase
VDANFAVGTIIGIFPGRGLLHRKGKEQVASLICVYGPKVTIALALNRSGANDDVYINDDDVYLKA